MELNELVRKLLELKTKESIIQGHLPHTRGARRQRLFDAQYTNTKERQQIEEQLEQIVGEVDTIALLKEVEAI